MENTIKSITKVDQSTLIRFALNYGITVCPECNQVLPLDSIIFQWHVCLNGK